MKEFALSGVLKQTVSVTVWASFHVLPNPTGVTAQCSS